MPTKNRINVPKNAEVVLSQRTNFARISLLKNYCGINDKPIKIVDISHFYNAYGNKIDPIPDERRNKKHYNDDEYVLGWSQPYSKWFRNGFFTFKDKNIKSNFNNPFADINIYTIKRTIIRYGDKVTIKCYNKLKTRTYNEKFFHSHTSIESITLNLITGNFTTLRMTKGGKRKDGKSGEKTFRTNSFKDFHSIIKSIFTSNRVAITFIPTKIFDNDTFIYEFGKILNIDNIRSHIENDINTKHLAIENFFTQQLIDNFIKIKKIKAPDDFYHLMKSYYPTEKYLKKNDRKLISAILDNMGLKSKITIKLLHKNVYMSLYDLTSLCYFFDNEYPKYIGNITNLGKRLGIIKSIENDITPNFLSINSIKTQVQKFKLTDNEKENIVKIINDATFQHRLTYLISDIHDHIKMINEIREYGIEIQFNAMSYRRFQTEHQYITNILVSINNGWEIIREYNETTVRIIQEKLLDFHPILLTKEHEYREEGSFMHHCVGSYTYHSNSIIVSIRTSDNDDRITGEFDVNTGRCIQSRYFYNGAIPEKYEKPLEMLSDKIKNLSRKDMLKPISLKRIPIVINGVVIVPKVKEPRPFFEELMPM